MSTPPSTPLPPAQREQLLDFCKDLALALRHLTGHKSNSARPPLSQHTWSPLYLVVPRPEKPTNYCGLVTQ